MSGALTDRLTIALVEPLSDSATAQTNLSRQPAA